MDILDPDLWNDDGTPKRPTAEYMQSLELSQEEAAFASFAENRRTFLAAQPATVGDIVHYWTLDDKGAPVCHAAIVIEVDPLANGICLREFAPNQPCEDWMAEHDEAKLVDGSWHWPEGV